MWNALFDITLSKLIVVWKINKFVKGDLRRKQVVGKDKFKCKDTLK
jgi:hypothetical protein